MEQRERFHVPVEVLPMVLALGWLLLGLPVCARGAAKMSGKDQTILPVGGNVAELNRRANDRHKTQAERAEAVFTLFARHIRPGATAAEVHGVLTDATWLKQTNLYGVYTLGGWVPVEMQPGTVFCVHLFPEDKERQWSPWVIYFRLTSESLSAEDARNFLKGKGTMAGEKIVEFALCFPASPKSRYRTPRIERYSSAGIRVYPGL